MCKKEKICPPPGRFFYFTPHILCGFFVKNTKGTRTMHLTLIKSSDEKKSIAYKIARVVYAETNARSLRVVEALTSMIHNLSISSGKTFNQIVSDKSLFEALNENSKNNKLTRVQPDNNGFQMCLRVAMRMLNGSLSDCCYGAIRFHREDTLPEWAMSKGYIADIDGLLFYL